jgi:hypothetical protein
MTEESPMPYDTLPALSAVYLEDSYVLDVVTGDQSVELELDLVLTEQHPAYREPRRSDQYCYRRACISIDNPMSVHWIRRTMRPFRDVTGDVDYGSIDVWRTEGNVNHIEGDWGELEIIGGQVRVILETDEEEAERSQDGHDGPT